MPGKVSDCGPRLLAWVAAPGRRRSHLRGARM